MQTTDILYTRFTKAPCCRECGYTHNTIDEMELEHNICPKCGGCLNLTIGRWMYTEVGRPWYDFLFIGWTRRIYHGFLRGRNTNIDNDGVAGMMRQHLDNVQKEAEKLCTCPGCKITNSGNGYQPCHNRSELEPPPPDPDNN